MTPAMDTVRALSCEAPSLQWGVAARTLQGEVASGDAYVVLAHPRGMLVAVIDALGHGTAAADPAARAVDTMSRHAHDPLLSIVQRCHDALVGTRGVVMSVASFDVAARHMTWVGIGNVEGVLLFADPGARSPRAVLVQRGGIVGARLPQSHVRVIPVSDGDTLVFATDGVRTGFLDAPAPAGAPQAIADDIMARHCRGTDDALVLVARFSTSGGAPVAA
jgi:negative regulator of sigma-B (phosphoserine phosphatase)